MLQFILHMVVLIVAVHLATNVYTEQVAYFSVAGCLDGVCEVYAGDVVV